MTFLGKQAVEPPPWIIPGPPDSVAGAALEKISGELRLLFNTRTQRFEVWNPGGRVKVVEGVRGEYVEPGVWLAAQLQIPLQMQLRAIDEANRKREAEILARRRAAIEAMTHDRYWVKAFVAFVTRDFTFIDKVFHVKVPWRR